MRQRLRNTNEQQVTKVWYMYTLFESSERMPNGLESADFAEMYLVLYERTFQWY